MSTLRALAAVSAVVVSGFAAVGCWVAGLFAGSGSGSDAGRVVWFVAAAGAALLGGAAWTWLLPRARLWAFLAVPVTVTVWFVVLGGLNT